MSELTEENDDNSKIVKPFLKWIGGKTQIIDTIIENYPKEMNSYHDIFVGGGSTLLALLSYVKNGKIIVSDKIYAYDLNNKLINVYKNVQKKPHKLYKKIKKISSEYLKCEGDEVNRKATTKEEALTSRESYYYWIRNEYNNLSDDEKISITGSAMFIFLNKTCFRGVYRIGPHGFNVPYGHYKNPKIIEKKTLLTISDLIKDVKFKCVGFEESLIRIKYNDFAYLDPPYAPEKTTSFVKYNSDGFDIEQHKKLFSMCENLMSNKIKFMMSNSYVKLVIDSFPKEKYLTEIIECRRAIHSKNPSKKTNEIIIKTF
jgi:DNA adenine methylase